MRRGFSPAPLLPRSPALPLPHSLDPPLPTPVSVILSPKLLMKTGVGSFYPCSIVALSWGPTVGLLRGINSDRLVRRRDKSLQWRFNFCRILLKQR
jgi:hypothetical protein